MNLNISKTFGLITILLSAVYLQSCMMLKQPAKDEDYAKENFTVANGCIPAEFGESGATVLVMLIGSDKYDEKVKESFLSYNGPYELVTQDDLKNASYADKDKYRYLFSFSFESRDYSQTDASHDTQMGSFNVRRFYISDRQEEEYYKANTTASFFQSLINGYVYNMNKELAK
jgi:hypothetical protein